MGNIEQLDLITLFQIDNPAISKPKKKREHFKIPTYTKTYRNDITDEGFVIDDINTWGKLKDIYSNLTNFIGFNPFDNSEIQEIHGCRVWNATYTSENYIHRGQVFKGQNFKIVETEIIGTEDFHISERLYLHENLLNALKEGLPLAEAMVDIRFLINLLKKGYTLDQSKYVLKTIKER